MKIEEIRVLICDDSIFARKKMRDFLLTMGISEVYEAADGQQAIDMYISHKPTVVFMDIIMPKRTGIEAVTEILKIDSKAKVVMASSVGTQSHLKDAINAGAYEFLQKPFSDEHVKKIIQNVAKGG